MKKKFKKVNASILIIGNEILSGRTQDKNVSFISSWLNKNAGIEVREVRIIPDIKKLIIKNILELSKNYKYVFTTGGIGPTHDDITSESISQACRVTYSYILEKYYGKKNFNDGRKKMAMMPYGSKLIYNPSSAAPGFKIKNIFCLPGVPSILNSMIENCKKFLIKGAKVHSKTINCLTVESKISKELGDVQKQFSKYVEIGSYPFFRLGKIGVSIVIRSVYKNKIEVSKKKIEKLIRKKKIKIFNN